MKKNEEKLSEKAKETKEFIIERLKECKSDKDVSNLISSISKSYIMTLEVEKMIEQGIEKRLKKK